MTFRAEYEHRDELRRAALAEFTERGYDAASLNRILGASQMSKGQLYYHFAGKEALFLALVEWMIDEKVRWLADHPPELAGQDFFAVLAAGVRSSIEFASSRPEVAQLTKAVLAERGRPVFDAVTTRFGFTANRELGALVELHHARGAFRPELTLEFVTRVVVLVVNNLPELLDLDSAADFAPRVDEIVAWLRHSLAHD